MADSHSFETCPTDIVHASSEQVWDVLTNPARLNWVGVKLVESPAHHLAVGDRLVFRPAPGLQLSWTVLAVEPLRTLEAEVSIERGPTIVAAQGRHDDDLVVPDPERHLDVELSRASIPSSGSGRRSCGVDRARRGRARDHHQRPTVLDVAAGSGAPGARQPAPAQRAGALFQVAAQAEAVEPEVAEAATAGRRATVGLCTEFWRRAEADGLVAEVADPRRLAVVSDLLVCAHTVVHRRHTTAGPRRHIGHSSSTPSPTLARPHQFWQIR